jgi:hypothetical protein
MARRPHFLWRQQEGHISYGGSKKATFLMEGSKKATFVTEGS